MIETDLRTSLWERVRQSVLFIRELKRIARDIVSLIDIEQLSGEQLIVQQNRLVQLQANFSAWPHGSLIDLNVRNEMVRQWPSVYATAAVVASDFSDIAEKFTDLQASLEALLVTARARGQLVDVDKTTGMQTSQILLAPDTDALRATAVVVRDSISGPV